ncbi:hypothetical protein PRK78_004127 [Emydomyces testavorans]|uniref:Methyltransferase type 11 domain-containing protein n=1 Tax=Emydomyces testavorans TaxID=2070801 RepID=A0AAF0DHA4_9EURO|nr:hypothetical protein PRK78_004127 [Emydomyces testavorans]
MAAAFNSSTRSPVSRQVRGDGALNTIMEDMQVEDGYGGRRIHSATTKRRDRWHEYDDRSHAVESKRGAHNVGPAIRISSPSSQYGDGNRHLISSTTRVSRSTDHRVGRKSDFDDLYDVTDESDRESCPSLSSQGETRSSGTFTVFSDISNNGSDDGRRKTFPALYIPSSNFTSTMKNSSVPPTPPPKIPVSPLLLAKLPRSVPAIAAPPSLAGSASGASDRHSAFSTPQTPDLADVPDVNWDEQRLRVRGDLASTNDSEPSSALMSPQVDIELDSPEDWSAVLGNFPRIPARVVCDQSSSVCESDHSLSVESSNRGVQLPFAALATLQRFDVDSNRSQSSLASQMHETGEMHEIPSYMRPRSTGDILTASAYSGSSFTSLSVPSPGGFFASLKGQARKTWCFPNVASPTSAVAETFYNLPWGPQEGTIVEQVVECGDDATEGPSTARAIASAPPTARRIPAEFTEQTQHEEIPDTDDSSEYDASYAEALKAQAKSNLDRTTVWLAGQSSYLVTSADRNHVDIVEESPKLTPVEKAQETTPITDRKKSVKFVEAVSEEPRESPSKPLPTTESLFYLGFQHVRRNSQNSDIFLHSNLRFEAIQAGRLGMLAKHVDQLNGKYKLNDPVRPPYRGPFSQAPRNSKLPEVLQEKAMYSNVEKEQDVLVQLHASTWAIEALKFLNGGPLIPSPAAKRLAKASPLNQPKSPGRRRVRVLDLGGQTACEWAWHLANEYPNVQIYTAVTKQQAVSPLDGPPNHRHVSVTQLWRLPFKDNQFDLISARSLHMLLKSSQPIDTEAVANDEVDMCLKECLRCLKPGGYLEFFLMDSEIVRAGTYGSATSVEFGFNLKTRGYDPAPTKVFLWRLRKARFGDIKRAWLFLPMGTPYNEDALIPGANTPTESKELVGSTADVASTTGLLGGWMWEQWMLKLQMEMGRDSARLLEETAAVIDEGRKCGAGWRCLSGWAMKPRKKRS